MGKPYSDGSSASVWLPPVLRGGLSRHKSAVQFGVGISTVINWVQRFQDTGGVAPGQGQMGGHKPRRSAASMRFSWRAASGKAASRCAGSWPNWANAASRSIIDRCGTSSTPKGLASKKPSSPASAIDPTSRAGASSGRTGRARSILSAWSSSTRPGRKPTCAAQGMGDARGEARGQGSLWPLENSDLPRRASP